MACLGHFPGQLTRMTTSGALSSTASFPIPEALTYFSISFLLSLPEQTTDSKTLAGVCIEEDPWHFVLAEFGSLRGGSK